MSMHRTLSVVLLALSATNALATPIPQTGNHEFGSVLARGDFNGDFIQDLVVGIPKATANGKSGAGKVRIVYGTWVSFYSSESQVIERSLTTIESNDRFGASVAVGSFNGDSFDDLAVGIPGARGFAGEHFAGAVEVFYGSPQGLGDTIGGAANISAQWLPPALRPLASDELGFSLVAGRFHSASVDSLAIGMPGRRVGGVQSAGVVYVVPFDSNEPLLGEIDVVHQNTSGILDFCEAADRFGTSLGVLRQGSSAFSSLLVGVPFEDFGPFLPNAGLVHTIPGSTNGLDPAASTITSAHDTGNNIDRRGPNDRFGWALAAVDFDDNGQMNMVVGVPGRTVQGVAAAGAIEVFNTNYFSPTYRLVIHQNTPLVAGGCEPGDEFGRALAVGDMTGDGYPDLAVGVPYEDIGSKVNAGAVNVLVGSIWGLQASGSLIYYQDAANNPGTSQASDLFGHSVTIGRFDSYYPQDLVMGVPGEHLGWYANAGAISVKYNGNPWLSHRQHNEGQW